MSYHIRLQQFEGPLDLLLHLIEKAKIDIQEIFVSEITEQYLKYLRQMEELDMEVASEFILIAATLVEIKSRSLLPKRKKEMDINLTDEMEDPEEKFIQHLLEYKKYKEASEKFRQRENVFSKVYFKLPEEVLEDDHPVVLTGLTKDCLLAAFEKVLSRKKISMEVPEPRQIHRDTFTTQNKIEQIKRALDLRKCIVFQELFKEDTTRIEVIVSFIALLELLKQNYVRVVQKDLFGDIYIMKKDEYPCHLGLQGS
ncbi:MAG: segregation and condensation protein A [Clostridia bacterium]